MRYLSLAIYLIICAFAAQAQIISTDPVFPRPDQPLTITYDASKGSGGLASLPAGADVYAHTGLITVQGGSGNQGQFQKEKEIKKILKDYLSA